VVNSGVAKGGFAGLSEIGGNALAKLGAELDAVLVQPTIVLDFANMKANRTIGNKATSSAELAFSLDPMSTIQVYASQGKGLAWLTYGTKKGASSDAPFAILGEKDSKSNSLEQGLGAALGMGVRNKKTVTQSVVIDSDRYEALALSAAKGWNTAFVAQVAAGPRRTELNLSAIEWPQSSTGRNSGTIAGLSVRGGRFFMFDVPIVQ